MKPYGDKSDFWCQICQSLNLEANARFNFHCHVCSNYAICYSCGIIHTIPGTDEYRKQPFTYIGPVVHCKASGKGKRNYDNGDVYEGDFKDGNIHGTGTYSYPCGQIYVGEYKDGKRNGTGTHTFPSGQMYVGEWRDGKKNGTGTHTWPDGRRYVGEWRDDKQNGTGKLTRADGSVQDGQWGDGTFLPQKG